MASKNRRRTGNGPGIGCLVWLAAMVIVALLFLMNLDSIRTSIKNTRILEILDSKGGAATTTVSAPPQKPVAPSPVKPSTTTQPLSAPLPAAKEPVPSQQSRTRAVSLFYVRIENDGAITRQEVKRAITVTDSPLSDTLAALLAGPAEDEIRRKLITLIPRGTKLLGVGVRGSTVTIDLNDAFVYNRYGIEGYAGQLKQIVYTATAFPGIQDVQLLIEGEARDYLGGEGVYIGRPISRNSF